MPKIEEIYWRAECSFAESHKHGMLAEILSVPWPEAVGIVTALFCQVRRQIPDGDISKIPDAVLRRWCHSRKITRQALQGAGWVDADGRVHGWCYRYSELAEKRAVERDKKRRQRDTSGATASRDVPDSRGQKGDVVPTVPSVHGIAREGEGEGEGYTSSLRSDVRGGAPPRHAPDVDRLWATYREATGRRPAPLTAKAAARLAEMIGWAGSLEAAERGVRKVGASAFHRGENADEKRWDALTDKPFRTADAFRGWCEAPLEPSRSAGSAIPFETAAQRAHREVMDRAFGPATAGGGS